MHNNNVAHVHCLINERNQRQFSSIIGGGDHIHIFVFCTINLFKSIVFTVCEHEYMNMVPRNYRPFYALGITDHAFGMLGLFQTWKLSLSHDH